ncbi:MAG: phosphoglucomutase (alpha-D-glucose-1,6-bisphosphate-dependent) [Pseudomonadales bacterium]
MPIHELAGKPAPPELLINVPRLVSSYYTVAPDPADSSQRVAFGTSGHRGSALRGSFNDAHVAAIAQAVCDYRRDQGIAGPLFLGMDTHALSEPAHATVLEVLAANDVAVRFHQGMGYTPTPVISHAILAWNRMHAAGARADGIVITPSHNPPADGGMKYNPPHGGPAETAATGWIEQRANALLQEANRGVRRVSLQRALAADTTVAYDFITPYVDDLENAVDTGVIRSAGLRMGVAPLGGAAVAFWDVIAARYRLDLEVVDATVDPAFGFMTVDKDGVIRMDCSSPYAMASLIDLKDRYDIAFGNDPDVDRHGIVTAAGLMNPNHYLAVAVDYLFRHRQGWPAHAAVGKTLVSSAMIDRVAASLGRQVLEVPVGFKWFVDGLLSGECGFAGEESAGASFLRMDGSVWTTDKDGILLNLLAAEITARSGATPADGYRALVDRFGDPVYERLDAPADAQQKRALAALSAEMVTATQLAGEPIRQKLTHAPGNGAAIGGLKVVADSGWFAARPSGTEDIYKIYTESFNGRDHLAQIQQEAQAIVAAALQTAAGQR